MGQQCLASRARGCLVVLGFLGALGAVPARNAVAFDSPDLQQVLSESKQRGGLVVLAGLPPRDAAKLAAAFIAQGPWQVHVLAAEPTLVQEIREKLRQKSIYGDASADLWRGGRLPYIENLVNLLVLGDTNVSESEIQRVLTPGGAALAPGGNPWRRIEKPRDQAIDEWTHYLHDASGNAVAHDDVVGPPAHLQWLGSPRWSRHHDRMASMSALVSAGGRMFYIMDEGSRVSIQLPAKWKLIARDAFNGTVLWKRDIEHWHNHLWPLKSGPTQLARRLVAVGDRVYVTLGWDEPLTCLDAATGETLQTYAGTKPTEEVVVEGDEVFVQVNPGQSPLDEYAPALNLGDQRRVAEEFHWNQQPRRLAALQAASGETLWSKESIVAPMTLTVDAQHVFYHDGKEVVCLDRRSGEEQWRTGGGVRERITFNFGPKLVVYDGVLLYAGGDREMQALDAETGKLLWKAPHAQSGYQSPEDLLVAGGLVWTAPTTRTGDTGEYTGRDPHTGEVRKSFPPDVSTYWFHHRCYIAKATDKFLIPSRTGIEFVDPAEEHWMIHHWVRGGCLYGVMPCNGLLYAPPHNCACYPEAKLYGFNALAPRAASRELGEVIPDETARLQRGVAFADPLTGGEAATDEWPTFRRDAARSAATGQNLGVLQAGWATDLGGRLSAAVVADGKLLVSCIDQHTVHALDAATGEKLWAYTAGGRVDSPPTIYRGRAVFGSADGYVYCLRLADGQLAWRFRAAPRDERLMSLEQLESVWPVHGSILVLGDSAYCVAGRSVFLDGGLRFLRLDVATGDKLAEEVMDGTDPDTGGSLQDRIQTLQMPVGLPDILSSDGRYIYMRSQQIDMQGQRGEIGPNSGNAAANAAVQGGETAHLFSPTGFLDSTWFHRAYWVFGRSFSGGHNGYFQAGKYAPSGRLLVVDDKNVYGFGRKPEYLKWTTTIEHQFFSAPREAPVAPAVGPEGRQAETMVKFPRSDSLNPTGQPISLEAWIKPTKAGGVVVARGGPQRGYALVLQNSRPTWILREDGKTSSIQGPRLTLSKWTHLTAVVGADLKMRLYVDGQLKASGVAHSLLTGDPAQSLEIGGDAGGAVGDYRAPNAFSGIIDQVRMAFTEWTLEEIQLRFAKPAEPPSDHTGEVLNVSFDDGSARDQSPQQNHGALEGVKATSGRIGKGVVIRPTGNARRADTFVQHQWTRDAPLFPQSILLVGDQLVAAGARDLIDEERTFERLTQRDDSVLAELEAQDRALRGEEGALLWILSTKDGSPILEQAIDSPPVWDGMAAAYGRLYLCGQDGVVRCWRLAEACNSGGVPRRSCAGRLTSAPELAAWSDVLEDRR